MWSLTNDAFEALIGASKKKKLDRMQFDHPQEKW